MKSEMVIDHLCEPIDYYTVHSTKIMFMRIARLEMRIIDSLNFLPMSLAEIPKAFRLSEDVRKGFFPYLFTCPENFGYKGNLPAKEMFGFNEMNESKRSEFLIWYENELREEREFDFENEMKAYCMQDVKILQLGIEAFRKMVQELTENMNDEEDIEICSDYDISDSNVVELRLEEGQYLGFGSKTKRKNNPKFCDPLAYTTLAGLCHAIFKAQYLKKDTIAQIPPGGYFNQNFSVKSMEWLEYLILSREVPNL
jgi:hypothetical protein